MNRAWIILVIMSLTAVQLRGDGELPSVEDIQKKMKQAMTFQYRSAEYAETLYRGNKKTERSVVITEAESGKKKELIYKKMTITVDGSSIVLSYPETVDGVSNPPLEIDPTSQFTYNGTEFYYEDLIERDFEQDYIFTVLRKEECNDTLYFNYRAGLMGEGSIEQSDKAECYVLSARPKYQSHYWRMVFWVGTDDFIIRRIDYYHQKESTPFKSMRVKELFINDQYYLYSEYEMLHLIDGTKTHRLYTPSNVPTL